MVACDGMNRLLGYKNCTFVVHVWQISWSYSFIWTFTLIDSFAFAWQIMKFKCRDLWYFLNSQMKSLIIFCLSFLVFLINCAWIFELLVIVFFLQFLTGEQQRAYNPAGPSARMVMPGIPAPAQVPPPQPPPPSAPGVSVNQCHNCFPIFTCWRANNYCNYRWTKMIN